MPSCTFACRRAVHRQLLPPTDAIWISDDVLRHAFRRLVKLSTATRRHGSFVPGPLEARRRLGKRRMAYYTSEPTPPGSFAFGSLWDIFRETDRTSFRWEAPTKRSSVAEAPAGSLQTWLSQWTAQPTFDQETSGLQSKPKAAQVRTKGPVSSSDVSRFRRSIRNADTDRPIKICQDFNAQLERSLTLGKFCNTALSGILSKATTKDIREAFSDTVLAEQHCLALYKAVWDGISACKTTQSVDSDGFVLNKLLDRLSELSITPEVQMIAASAIRSASEVQLGNMKSGIDRIVCAWARTWLENHEPESTGSCLENAATIVSDIDHLVLHLDDLIAPLGSRQNENINLADARTGVYNAQLDVLRGINAIDEADDSIFPTRHSVRLLSSALATSAKKNPDVLLGIINHCSNKIDHLLKQIPQAPASRLRYDWLSLMAEFAHEYDTLFVRVWRTLGPPKSLIDESIASDIVLKLWMKQGLIGNPPLLRNAWEATPISQRNFASLLAVVDKYQELPTQRAGDLFKLLYKLDRYNMVPGILSRMQKKGLRLPPTMMNNILRFMNRQDSRAAYKIYRLWFLMHGKTIHLGLERNPEFIISLVQNTAMTNEIWRMLRIPVYRDIPRHAWSRFAINRNARLTHSDVKLVKDMAVAFARSESRPPRAALRGVAQCLYHLRIHGVPMTPELTRALCYVGLTRPLLKYGMVPQERLTWIISWVNRIEGKGVANDVNRIVYRWRMYHSNFHRRLHRRRSNLRVHQRFGVID